MANLDPKSDIEKIPRTIELPELTEFKEVINWSRQLNEKLTEYIGKIGNNVNENDLQIIHDKKFDANATTYSIGNVDGDEQRIYLLTCRFYSEGGAATTLYKLRFNADSGNNYGYAYHGYDGSQIGGIAQNQDGCVIGRNDNSDRICYSKSWIWAQKGYIRAVMTDYMSDINGETIRSVIQQHSVWSNTADNITNLTILADQTDGLGAGTRIELWSR